MIFSGKLRHRATLQSYVLGSPQQTATGEEDGSWTDVATVSCSIEPVTGREPFMSLAHLAEVTHKVRMRYRSDVTAQMRLVFKGRIFDIKGVLNWDERNVELLLPCSEGLSDG